MWCPEGYLTYHEIYRAFRKLFRTDEFYAKTNEAVYLFGERGFDLSNPLLHAFDSPLGSVDRGNPSRQDIMRVHELYRNIIEENCLVEFFSTCLSLSFVSSSGVCLRVNPRFFVHRHIPNIGKRIWLSSENRQSPEVGFVQPFIDPRFGTISSEFFNKCLESVEPYVESMRSKIKDIDQDEQIYLKYVQITKIEDDKELLDSLKEFEGWAVCCRIEDSPEDPFSFISLDLQHDDIEKPLNTQTLKSQIIEAFDRGEIRSKDSLWRERFADESRDAFRASWDEAKQERPDLARRGPKPLININ